MSRITKWKLEKAKVKVVFRLQFHASHVPQSGWDKLFISFIPADIGKTTAKTTKANVRNGTCKWADPIYETTRLLQDPKSKQYDEKLYNLVVAMGSSRASVLGEATINLSDYVDALKPSMVALPLHGCDLGTVLHITVQLLTSKTGFREFEQQRDQRERGLQAGINSHSNVGVDKIQYLEEEELIPNEEYANSGAGFDGLSNTSDNRIDTSSVNDVVSLQSTTSDDFHAPSHLQNLHLDKEYPSSHQNMDEVSKDSALRWGSDYAIDNELSIACEENNRLRESLELADSSYIKLKSEVSSLQSLANELGTETEKFSQLLVSEISSVVELKKEVSCMKSECLKFKDDIIMLKDLKCHINTKRGDNQTDNSYQDMQCEFMKILSAVEDKVRDLQSKVYIEGRDYDYSYVCAELETVLKILPCPKRGNSELISSLNPVVLETVLVKDIREISTNNHPHSLSGNGFGLDFCQPNSILQHFSVPTLVSDPVCAIDALKGQIFDLVRELDEAKIEKECLTQKMGQMECYYEDLIQELEENQKQLMEELQNLRGEHSGCLITLSASRAEMESMRLDMNQKMLELADERHDLDVINKELESRVASLETALRRARLNYSVAVERLQNDLELLSSQVVSMFETNEKLIKQAFVEPSEACLKGNQNEDQDATNYQNESLGSRTKSVGGEILLDDSKRSFSLQEELYQKVEEELLEMCIVNMNLDIYSKALKESLFDANANLIIAQRKMDEYVEELDLSAASQNQLMSRLQKATEDIHVLNEFKLSCLSECHDMAVQNQNLEEKLEKLSLENHLFSEKLKDLENIKSKCLSYESRLEKCLLENSEKSLQLKQETFKKEKLHDEIFLLNEKLISLNAESDELTSLNKNLEKQVSFQRDKLVNILESYNNQFFVDADLHHLNLGQTDINGVILQLEETQHHACLKICHLFEQNSFLEGEKVSAQVSLNEARLEILALRQKFKTVGQDFVTKLDVSNSHVEKLQAELDSIANQFQFSSEIAEAYTHQSEMVLADLILLEDQMWELASRTGGAFVNDSSCLKALTVELGNNRSTISALSEENLELVSSLLEETGQSIKLSSENTYLKSILKTFCINLQKEKSYIDQLEGKIQECSLRLNEKNKELIVYKQSNAELMHLRDLASAVELENSRLAHLLEEQKDFVKVLLQTSTCAECELLEIYGHALAADITSTFISNQYDVLHKDDRRNLLSANRSLEEVKERYHGLQLMFNQSVANEAQLNEEKVSLVASLRSLESELEFSEGESRILSISNDDIHNQLCRCKSKLAITETGSAIEENQRDSEIEKLKHKLVSTEKELDYMTILNEELEIFVIILKGKLIDQCDDITLMESYKDSVKSLRTRCLKISYKLNEQVLKTEEFKNLSIHFKELKDKAEAECLLAREKREADGLPTAANDSLRMAFMKEQHATQLLELGQQISVSKKHGEDVLLKLQDAIDEVENRKKSEAVNLKRNEELSQKIIALETECQLALSEKRDLSKAYDRVNAELECALLSLECCKEEYAKLEFSLEEHETEKSQLSNELNFMRVQLANCEKQEKSENGTASNLEYFADESTGNTSAISLDLVTMGRQMLTKSNLACEEMRQGKRTLEVVAKKSPERIRRHLDVNSEILGSSLLKSSMEHLHEELEKMKNENIDFHIDHDVERDDHYPQSEIIRLHKANEELRGMFPLFNEISSSGNALERVLAFEIKLAEALKEKNKSGHQFQSSLLNQHGDDESAFRSFRDINELIEETLELKGRHATIEAELRDMHDRYSKLSLQFAEVEGDRQKLKMTLKNIRSSKKLLPSTQSTTGI